MPGIQPQDLILGPFPVATRGNRSLCPKPANWEQVRKASLDFSWDSFIPGLQMLHFTL
jgi:hypothetical protein